MKKVPAYALEKWESTKQGYRVVCVWWRRNLACTMVASANPLVAPSPLRDIVKPQFHQLNLKVEEYLKHERGIKLDKDDQICRAALSPAGCPLGPRHCPLRHTMPSPMNFQPNQAGKDAQRMSTVSPRSESRE